MTQQTVVAVVALIAVGVIVVLGRRDLTHPAVAFGVVWFSFVAVAQVRLTQFERPWSIEFAVLVLGGGGAFVTSAFLASGLAPTRGTVHATEASYSGGRLMIAAFALLVGGLVGLAWKASILGGIPAFSNDIDNLRARAYGPRGDIRVPAWSTFLTNGFHLGLWCLLAAAWCGWGRSWARRGVLGAGVLLALLGAFSGGSRNELLFALVVPVVAAYQLRARLSSRSVLALATVGALTLTVASTVFLVRVHQREAGRDTFLNREVTSVPVPLRPLAPLYFGGAFSLEGERRLVELDPFSRTAGAASLQGLPDPLFPEGKLAYSDSIASITYTTTEESPYWTVATYQGRAFVDFGTVGVPLISVLLGVLFGGVYRACRGRSGLMPLALLGFCSYYAAFLFYDNLMSLAVMSLVYDLAILAVLDRIAARRRRDPATERRSGRRPDRFVARRAPPRRFGVP